MQTRYLAVGACGALALIALFSFGILHVSGQRAEASPASEQTAAATSIQYAPGPTVPVTNPVGDGRRSYENSAYRFALQYPEELIVHEYGEADDAISVIFKDATTGRAFQIYVTPYEETQITDERFALDQPSGVRENARNFHIGGVQGARFDGNNAAMGDTAEIWVISNGYLYEIVTYKTFGAWLEGIMQNWTFL